MSKLAYYTAAEKNHAFRKYDVIKSANNFDEWYKQIYSAVNDNFIYRGAPNATYYLYTSSQRLWRERGLLNNMPLSPAMNENYLRFLQQLRDAAKEWNKGVIPAFYNNLGITLNDFALFSLMQHAGLPTPMLDFTYDIDIALYFAFYYANLEPSNILMNDYVSVYMIDLEDNKDFLTMGNQTDLTLEFIYAQKKLFVFTEVKGSDLSDSTATKNYTNTNFNIINQKGVFVFNFHPWKPIGMSDSRIETTKIKNIICVDIHKSLKEHVLAALKQKGITSDYLFVDFNKFKVDVQRSCMEKFSII